MTCLHQHCVYTESLEDGIYYRCNDCGEILDREERPEEE
jgi:hypothetical protein